MLDSITKPRWTGLIDGGYCGAVVLIDKRPYCPTHYALAYYPARSK